MHNLDILIILEPKIQGSQVDEVCRKLGFDDWIRVEGWGTMVEFVFFFKKVSSFSFCLLSSDPQFIHGMIQVNYNGDWFITVIYGFLNVMAKNHVWA